MIEIGYREALDDGGEGRSRRDISRSVRSHCFLHLLRPLSPVFRPGDDKATAGILSNLSFQGV